jgi:hypothetical protein
MSDSDIAEYFKQNPRMIGAAFTLLLLLTQAGNAAASASGSYPGP